MPSRHARRRYLAVPADEEAPQRVAGERRSGVLPWKSPLPGSSTRSIGGAQPPTTSLATRPRTRGLDLTFFGSSDPLPARGRRRSCGGWRKWTPTGGVHPGMLDGYRGVVVPRGGPDPAAYHVLELTTCGTDLQPSLHWRPRARRQASCR